jgi:hypothetical protein
MSSQCAMKEGFYALGLEGILRREGRTFEGKPPACCVSGGDPLLRPGAFIHYRPEMLRGGDVGVPIRLRRVDSINYFACRGF